MSQLDKVKIEGFKSIREMDLNLNMLNVLIGANGVGKSNFVSLFRMLNQVVEGRFQSLVGKAGGADALMHFGQKHTAQISIELWFGANSYKCVLVPSAKGALIFDKELAFFQGQGYDTPYQESLGSGHSESNLEKFAQQGFLKVILHVFERMNSWRVYHFHDTSETAKVKQIHDIGDNDHLRPDAANLAAFLYLLKQNYRHHYEQIVQTVRLAAPFFDDFVLRPLPLNPNKIQLEWSEKDSDAYFNAHSLSDGTLRFMSLTTLLQQPSVLLPSTLLIDEPELGLHPYAITLLASMLQSAATKTQVIVSTQSVPLVNQFAPEDLIVVDREDGQSVFRRLDSRELDVWLEDYGLGELWEKNLIGGRP